MNPHRHAPTPTVRLSLTREDEGLVDADVLEVEKQSLLPQAGKASGGHGGGRSMISCALYDVV
jgi:hypothetical protein